MMATQADDVLLHIYKEKVTVHVANLGCAARILTDEVSGVVLSASEHGIILEVENKRKYFIPMHNICYITF